MTAINDIPAFVGVGLRDKHLPQLMDNLDKTDWFEILADNYRQCSHHRLQQLDNIRIHKPFALHSVALNLASNTPLDTAYINDLKTLVDRYDPLFVSDHCAWCAYHDYFFPELLPFPYNEDTLTLMRHRVDAVQNQLQRPLTIENITTYMHFQTSTLSQYEFLNALAKQTGCTILLDVNNIYVNQQNHLYPTEDWQAIEPHHVAYMHLAGYSIEDQRLLDTHSRRVQPNTWTLFQDVIRTVGAQPTIIEWDQSLPSYTTLCEQANRARSTMQEIQHDILA